MTRRILLAFVGLTVAILAAAVIPLGIEATGHDYHDYVEDSISRAQTAAGTAEEWLGDHSNGPVLGDLVAASRRGGDRLVILSTAGKVLATGRPAFPLPASLITQAKTGATSSRRIDDQLIVVVPVREAGPVLGEIALVRPTHTLDQRIMVFWLTLAAIAAAALVAAAAAGLGLARWVARPLALLDTSARQLGDGDLTVRAPASSGPGELRRLAATFNTMAGRLETLVHGHRAVIADVSHQLRTPLAALRLRLDLLAADADERTATELGGALGELARLSRLVDGLLAVARAENLVPHPVPVDVRGVIMERVDAWVPVAAERGVRIGTAVPRRVTALLGEGYLEQILDNLLANALDATGEGHRVTVSAMPIVEGVRVTVADNGPGMSQAERDRAFRRFATGSPGGTGLGLAIVHRLASSSGGTAHLAETAGGGLTVILDLPAAPAISPPPGRPGTGPLALPGTGPPVTGTGRQPGSLPP
jgi:signal transduction histidine kinase